MKQEEAAISGGRRASKPGRIRSWIRGEQGAVGTEMAIVVAIVVAISLALGVVMRDSAEAHQECIPAAPGDAVPAGC